MSARECTVCWYLYRPEEGDDVWQVPPGTPFEALPADWRCPRCDADRTRFVPVAEPVDRVAQLVEDYQAVAQGPMRAIPLCNPHLSVEAVGFEPHDGGLLGALVTPWSINVVFLPPAEVALSPRGHARTLPGGAVDFLPQKLATAGTVEVASLFSPALEFEDQRAAVATAAEALRLLRSPPPPPAHRRRDLLDALRGRSA